MEINSKNKSGLNYLKRPWVIETIVFFLVCWQEAFRLSSRTAHKILPVSRQIQEYYYYNFGDFVNGYIIAYIADGLVSMLLLKSAPFYRILGFQITKRINSLLATLFSSSVVIVYELAQQTSTTSDISDIPAGIAGALLFLITRLIALKLAEKQ